MNYLSILVAYLVVLSIHVGIAIGQVEVDIKTDSKPSTIESSDDDQLALPFFIRLHLIRHGETHANVQNIVLGQGDSPLTENGVNVARLAAASDMINGSRLKYWRHYCSDLKRAHRSARIVLGIEKESENNSIESASTDINLIVDSRLRELAKGPREGYLKKYTHEEAIALRREAAGVSNNDISVPKLESLDDAYARVVDWIDSIIADASEDYETCRSEGEEDIEPKVYDVFALSHSALIRTVIHKMVDHQLPTDYKKTKEGSLRIPNLSRTIIDIQPYKSKRWTPSLNRLTDISHLIDAANSGPPYL